MANEISPLSDLPPLPEFAAAFRPRWPGDTGGFTEVQMRAYAQAIETTASTG